MLLYFVVIAGKCSLFAIYGVGPAARCTVSLFRNVPDLLHVFRAQNGGIRVSKGDVFFFCNSKQHGIYRFSGPILKLLLCKDDTAGGNNA